MDAVKRTMTGCLVRGLSESCRLSVFLFVLVFSSSSYSACTDWIARVVSIQGSVDVRVVNTADWKPVALQQTYCSGDTIRVQANSRAALELHNDTILRLNQNTTLSLASQPTTSKRPSRSRSTVSIWDTQGWPSKDRPTGDGV